MKLIRAFLLTLIALYITNVTLAAAVHDLGILSDLKIVKNTNEHMYKFSLPFATPVTIFLNGLSAGYQIELQDPKGEVLAKASNLGTYWKSPANPGESDGVILISLNPGYYFVRVSPVPVDTNVYRVKDKSYTLNLIPDNAPKTVIVAASDSPTVGITHFKSIEKHDQKAINQAIDLMGRMGGGRVLLRPGTYHINNNIKVIFDNITIMGSGWKTILKLTDNVKMEGTGLLRSRYSESSRNIIKNHFSSQHFLHLVLDGNKDGNPFFISSVGNYGTYVDSSFEDVRAHDFPRYGLDPHESIFEPDASLNNKATLPTSRLIIKDSLIDHNEKDGIVFEKTVDSTIVNNIVDGNGRHGINVVGESLRNDINANIITNNLANGIVIQPGQERFRASNLNHVQHNLIHGNHKNGIHLFLASNTVINQNVIRDNGWYGIHLRASSNNTITENELNNNSDTPPGNYAGINLSGEKTTSSSQNIISKNHLETLSSQAYKFGIVEHDSLNDFNQILNNTLVNISKPLRLKGPHTVEQGNETLNHKH